MSEMIMKRRGLLRPWTLSMLNKGPKNGADIINEVGKASFGWWRPSPGSVYPMLEDMCQDGLIQKRDDGKYEITERGREETYWSFGPWSNRPRSVDEILNEIEAYVSYFEDLARSDKSKMKAHSSRIKAVANRFSRLADPSQG
jgi:DNA-binding PadR family transcriptional regulator